MIDQGKRIGKTRRMLGNIPHHSVIYGPKSDIVLECPQQCAMTLCRDISHKIQWTLPIWPIISILIPKWSTFLPGGNTISTVPDTVSCPPNNNISSFFVCPFTFTYFLVLQSLPLNLT